ncbi:MAG TPA: hypothetical protein HPQ04_14310 [Rhodospirillaceae bacterium]|nr:hypothetical protein [Rhodospirillaceae bacterium]
MSKFLIPFVLALVALGGVAEAKDGPPACAAISFRPLPMGMQNGTQDAGLYRSRFGKIVLRAEVADGQAKTYYIEVDGKRPAPLAGALPAAVNPCLNSKHVKTPAPAAGDKCLGERFRTVIDRSAKHRLIMLFALQGDAWHLCSASEV